MAGKSLRRLGGALRQGVMADPTPNSPSNISPARTTTLEKRSDHLPALSLLLVPPWPMRARLTCSSDPLPSLALPEGALDIQSYLQVAEIFDK